MKIMFHCGSGNTDRPNRWGTINTLFSDLGNSLMELGHDVSLMVHGAAKRPHNDSSKLNVKITDTVDTQFIDEVNPDVCVTWNGNSDGDAIFIDHVGKNKMIYGELGFFGHYDKNCYFDACGVNTRHSIIGSNFSRMPSGDDSKICDMLQSQYLKPRIFNEPYIFVPMQDETDTQITQYSPFKTMNEFLEQVFDIFRFDDRKILYKLHPLAPAKITLRDPKLIEVKNDVHHYLPYADFVFGLNSTVMVETLLYHSKIITYGCGIASRHFSNGNDRQAFVAEMYRRQMKWDDLKDPQKVKDSYFYKILQARLA
jgi:hypothetical protein